MTQEKLSDLERSVGFPIFINGVRYEQRSPKGIFQKMLNAYREWKRDYDAATSMINRREELEKKIARNNY